MTAPTFGTAVATLKRELNEAVVLALGRFESETGVTPSGITIDLTNTTPFSELGRIRRFVVSDVRIEFDL